MRRSILTRRKRRRINKQFELQLTSLMDILIIIVVFMLKSYSANQVNFATATNIVLPTSSAEEPPPDAMSLIIDPKGITVDSEKVVEFYDPYEIESRLLGDSGRRILPLYDVLTKAREKVELMMSKAVWKNEKGETVPAKFQGVLVIQADKTIQYELLRKIMYTAGAAQYKTFKLLIVKKES
ncbi:MAG: ExbD/TolR family protein [Bacteriovoracia bacterium]